MACCGDKRQRLIPPGAKTNSEMSGGAQSARAGMGRVYDETARFQYTGRSGLTVIGPFSQRRYRFNQPDEVLEVDRRDAPGLAAVPHLRWLRRDLS